MALIMKMFIVHCSLIIPTIPIMHVGITIGNLWHGAKTEKNNCAIYAWGTLTQKNNKHNPFCFTWNGGYHFLWITIPYSRNTWHLACNWHLFNNLNYHFAVQSLKKELRGVKNSRGRTKLIKKKRKKKTKYVREWSHI